MDYKDKKYAGEIGFIASRYRKGHFNVEKALRRVRPQRRLWWTPARIAAASAVVVAMSACAAVMIRQAYFSSEPSATVEQPTAAKPALTVRAVDFDNAPLSAVVEEIRNVYGVEVAGLPENPDDYRLSLHYEGTAADLVENINDIFGINMIIVEQ
ncbi:MAG: hypothetical protein K2M97_03645 [Muribaculaceae bacterium]|nr:hypothetical protein [Muribaculaceae bacterium]